jgi:hypothetical protein
MNEESGSTSADSSGNGNTLTLNGATWTLGKYSNALSFNGSTAYASVPDSNSLDLTTAGTVELWFKRNGTNSWQSLIAKGNANSNPAHNYYIEFNPSNSILYGVGNGSLMADGAALSVTDTASFHHIAMTWDGTNVRLYYDGTLQQTIAQTITPTGNTSPLYSGQFGGNAYRFNGTIDDIRIYNRALSQSEIQTDMNTPIGGATVTPSPTPSTTATPSATPTPSPTPTTTPTPSPSSAPLPSGDFAIRCAAAGVIKCVGFDAAGDIAGGYGANSGSYSGTSIPVLDNAIRASGNSSILFTIPSNSGANTSGGCWANFFTGSLGTVW